MANEPEQVDTPESIAEMEARVQAFRAKEAQNRADALREKAAPLIGLVNSDGFKAVSDAVPAIEQLANDSEAFPHLRDHIAAVRNGIFGLRQMVQLMPAGTPEDAPAPAEAE